MNTRLIESHLYLVVMIAVLLALLFSATTAQALAGPRPFESHSFTGLVLEVRAISLLGYPAVVAQVETARTAVWVIQKLDTVTLGNAQSGDQVRVSIRGPHVFREHVDWRLCQPAGSDYCRWGSLYEEAPLSLDWGVPLSPSNLFMRFGGLGPYAGNALYWNTESIDSPSRPAVDDPEGTPNLCRQRALR